MSLVSLVSIFLEASAGSDSVFQPFLLFSLDDKKFCLQSQRAYPAILMQLYRLDK